MPAGGPPPAFVCKAAATPGPFLFTVPHSGRYYPTGLTSRTHLSGHTLRMSEDAFVDHLFEAVPGLGGTLLVATHARAYLDLNRSADELDADMFSPRLDPRELDESHRVRAGLGLIPRLVAEGLPIYDSPLPAREAAFRTDAVYRPYHEKLASLLMARYRGFGHAVLIDCHSMPSDARTGRGRHMGPDIVLGDNWGSACARELTSHAEELLIRAGFGVRRNVPYSGGFTTQHYGAPARGIHALQIEINRAIYMDEEKIEPLPYFAEVQARLASVARELISAHGVSAPAGAHLPRAAE